MKPWGVRPSEPSLILECLCDPPRVGILCSNLKPFYIEPIPLHSPRPVLVELYKSPARRRGRAPVQSLTVRVRCGMLIPATGTFLTAWEGPVEGGARVKYEQEGEWGADSPDDGYVGWHSRPEEWPKMVDRTGRQRSDSQSRPWDFVLPQDARYTNYHPYSFLCIQLVAFLSGAACCQQVNNP